MVPATNTPIVFLSYVVLALSARGILKEETGPRHTLNDARSSRVLPPPPTPRRFIKPPVGQQATNLSLLKTATHNVAGAVIRYYYRPARLVRTQPGESVLNPPTGWVAHENQKARRCHSHRRALASPSRGSSVLSLSDTTCSGLSAMLKLKPL